jgi:hypothetical protein
MNANDTVTVVRDSLTAKDSLAGVHMNTPPDAIARNGRARRRWHRATGLTGAIAAMAGTALAVTALAPSGHPASQSGHPASHPRTAQLAAWTVAKQANGDIKVTVRQLSNPSGLQSTLRADGVPASVTSLAQRAPSCRPYPQTQALFKSIYQAQKAAGSGNTILVIHPSAIPSGAGVQIGAAVDQQVADRGLYPAAVNQAIHHAVHQPVHQVAARGPNGVIRVGWYTPASSAPEADPPATLR